MRSSKKQKKKDARPETERTKERQSAVGETEWTPEKSGNNNSELSESQLRLAHNL
jgi:hypothetical protein